MAAAAAGTSVRTIRDWLARVESGGTAALAPAIRADAGKARVAISRQFDRGIDLDEAGRARVVKELEKHAKTWAADGTSRREMIRLGAGLLPDICVENGSRLSPQELAMICQPARQWTRQFDRFRVVELSDRDHKAYQDKVVPRIGRELAARPMQTLAGDVNYMDFQIMEGGATIRARLIAWQCEATGYLWVTVALLPPGKGIRQQDVAQSLFAVATDWGLPACIRVDNGAEYAALAEAADRMCMLAEREGIVCVRKTTPYTPTGKGQLEGCFRILNAILKSLPGYIGGNRTAKRTEAKGRVVQPWSRPLDEFVAAVQTAAHIYNTRPQSKASRLKGLSPVQMYELKTRETGFTPTAPDAETFDVIFAKSEPRTVQQSSVRVNNRRYYAPFLAEKNGEAVLVSVPMRGQGARVWIEQRNIKIGWAEEQKRYAHDDPAGARDQARMAAEIAAGVRALKAELSPEVSTFADQAALAAKHAPMPHLVQNFTIDKTRLGEPDPGGDADDAEVWRHIREAKDRRGKPPVLQGTTAALRRPA